MSWPVTLVDDGGAPVVESPHGTPMTPVAADGTPVVLVSDNGTPVKFVDEYGQISPGGAVSTTLLAPQYIHPGIDVVRAGATATYFDAGEQLQTAPANTLRYDYSNPNGAGWLIEKSSANLIRKSNDFTDVLWTNVTTTITPGYNDGAGGTTASLQASTATSGVIQQAPTVVSGSAYTGYFWMKRISGVGQSYLRIGDLTLIPVDVPTDWARVTATATPTSTTGRLAHRIETSGDAVAIKYSQLELGTEPTSYIPSDGSALTRAADDVSLLLADLPQWNPLEGTFVVDFVAGPDVLSGKMLIDLNGSGGSNERLRVQTDATGKIILIVTSLGAAQASMLSGAAIIPYTRNKVAISFKQDAFNLALNGVLATPDTSGLMPVLDRIQFGANYTKLASTFLNGHINRVRYFPTALGSNITNLWE